MLRALIIALAAAATAAAASAQVASFDLAAIKTYDRAAYSRAVTPCDRAAAHPNDPEKVTPGLEREAIDIPRAIKLCAKAVAADPDNPRLNYQLARLYGYSGRHAEGEPYRLKALLAGYPQSLFVTGYILTIGWEGVPKDACLGAELVLKSAQAKRFAGLVGFPHYVVNGAYDGCPVRKDKAEMAGFLKEAKPLASDFYERILIENLEARVAALP